MAWMDYIKNVRFFWYIDIIEILWHFWINLRVIFWHFYTDEMKKDRIFSKSDIFDVIA